MVWVTNGLDCPNITFIDPVLHYAQPLFGLVCHMTQKRCEKKWLFVVPRFFLFMSRSSDRLSQKGVPCNQPCPNIVLFTKEAQGENNHDCFYFLWFYRVLIRVIIMQEMLIKQVPLVADTWGKLNHLSSDTKNLFYIFFATFFPLYIQILRHPIK